jgi:hypothetical protein
MKSGQDQSTYYAQRKLVKREVLPAHVADALFALTATKLGETVS